MDIKIKSFFATGGYHWNGDYYINPEIINIETEILEKTKKSISRATYGETYGEAYGATDDAADEAAMDATYSEVNDALWVR